MNINFFTCILLFLFFPACTRSTVPVKGVLGYSDKHTIVIVGENVAPLIAEYYQKKYDALVWFTAYKGDVAHFTNNMVESGIGPSIPMRALIVQLKSINQTVGRWQIYIPKIAETYFIHTLKHIENGGLSKARGSVVLIDSGYAPQIEREVKRVTEGSFFVEYETQKD